MNAPRKLAVLSLLTAVTLAVPPSAAAAPPRRPDLEYLEAVNRAGPPKDPQLLFLLMSAYSSAGRRAEGIDFLSARLAEFGPRLTDVEKSLYQAAIGVLAAERAGGLSLFSRVGAVKEALRHLDEAKRLSSGRVFVVRWMSGVVASRLPSLFGRGAEARADLAWCLENAEQAPHPGWLRLVYLRLSALARKDGNAARAEELRRLAGGGDPETPIALTTPFSEDPATGHTFSARRISEPVPGRVYTLSGFEFTEYHFVVTADGKALVGIDAGTRPDSARAAWEALHAHAPQLPPLAAVLVTHSHWDHVGGHRFFRSLPSHPRFYARRNFADEIAKETNAPTTFGPSFFGKRFDVEDVRTFAPDVPIDGRTDVSIGGTRFELVPVRGGETEDALLVHVPELGVLFAGDIVMPFLGAPFVEEGSLDGLLEAIDEIAAREPRVLLHGHEPLTRIFSSPSLLARLKPRLAWLKASVLDSIRRGVVRADIQQANLIAPGVLQDPDLQLPWLLLRENVIDRLYDQNVGYWEADLSGIDVVSRADRGSLLVDYLGASESRLTEAARRMIADGNPELAAEALEWTKERYGRSASFREVYRLTYLKLMEKYQNTNPFKFILYASRIGESVPRVGR